MADVSSETNERESAEISERFLTMLGVGSAVMQVVVFTAVGVMTLKNVPYSVVIGGFTGAGTFFFLPWLIDLSSVQDEGDAGLGAATERVSRSTGSGVFGLGLEIGGIVMFALGFTQQQPSLLLGVVSALTVAVGVYLAGSFVLRR